MQTRFSEGDTVYYTQKFLDKPPAAGEGDNDWPVLRYPDVLLLDAEALNETGSTNEALAYISRVRNRAGLASLDNIDQISLREAIQHERRVELCFEGHRWFDLLRTDTMISTMQTYKEKYAGTDHGHRVADYDVTPNKVLFPIPFREIELNPNLEQNTGSIVS